MEQISQNVMVEDSFPGCSVGVIVLPHGTIQVDAPPSPEDVRMLRASLMGLNTGAERILINLDSHLDRSLGVKLMDCPVIMHEKTAELIKARPNNVKLQNEETGSDWESISGIGNVRWFPPEITFTHDLSLHWNDTQVQVTHHAGCNPGASWVEVLSEKVLFIGDAAVKDQPLFYGHANFDEWVAILEDLIANYSDHKIISGRGGLIQIARIEEQIEILAKAKKIIDPFFGANAPTDKIEKAADKIFKLEKYPDEFAQKYQQRVRYGIKNLLSNNA